MSMELQFNFQNVPALLVEQIQAAIQTGEPFGLTNGLTLNAFNPQRKAHYYSGNSRTYLGGPTIFFYGSMNEFTQGISLALLSCKEFVPEWKLLAMGNLQKLLE